MKSTRLLALWPRAALLLPLGLAMAGCGADISFKTREVEREEYNSSYPAAPGAEGVEYACRAVVPVG